VATENLILRAICVSSQIGSDNSSFSHFGLHLYFPPMLFVTFSILLFPTTEMIDFDPWLRPAENPNVIVESN